MAEIKDEFFEAALERWFKLQQREQNMKIAKMVLLAIAFVASFAFALSRQSGFEFGSTEDYAALVKIEGVIKPGSVADSNKIGGALREAFRDENAKGVVLLVNSGGGTPVQAMTIYRDVLRLKEKYNKPVIAVAEDSMASGAYLLAMSADTIYAMPSSTVGSIGVIMESVAYSGLAEKLGVESRVYTAGGEKRRFNPFIPEKETDVAKATEILGQVHKQFIDIVKQGRGNRLTGPVDELFSGDFWTGEQALKYGLIDHMGTLTEAITAEFGVEVFKQFRVRSGFEDVVKAIGL